MSVSSNLRGLKKFLLFPAVAGALFLSLIQFANAVDLVEEACPRMFGEPLTDSGVFTASQIRCRLALGQSQSEVQAEIKRRQIDQAAALKAALRQAAEARGKAIDDAKGLCIQLKTELKDGRFLLSGSPLRALFQDRDPGLLTMFDKFSYSNGRSPFGLKIKKDGTEAIGDLVFAMRNTEDFLVENAKDAEVFEERWPQSYALKTPSPLSYALRCLYLDVFGEIQPRITY